MRHSPHVRIPVSLQVGLSHLRIISVRLDMSDMHFLTNSPLGQISANIAVTRL